ncbi:protein LIFEGUARD 2-like [Cucurbita pepo subsp. pepo]|uniref:protein LIFEGUARD 2-like n=1 Tax=Cucurbita pepo subsp. pepo TaxID=3664 RepID=UPI000C9D456E|nr:protein LIFEGUARD 2-like [Cucurbita pepo subsp. pepo]
MGQFRTKGDLENDQFYPIMMDSPQLRWAFIRKVYTIISMQLLLTTAVAAAVVFIRPIPIFFVKTTPGLIAYIGILVFTFIVLCPLYAYHRHHPWNFILLTLFTIGIAFSVGISCAFTKGSIILEAAAITCVVVVGLTLYTFWAVKRGHDFSFLGPFLFAALLVMFTFSLIMMFFPMGKLSVKIYGGISALIFCGYIVYDTDNLIKRFSYDDYIWAAVSLYLDIINLFISLLRVLDG